ncbi:MAG: purine-nucleoside phosphorylase [Treponemataceae bacterium]
MHDIYSKDAGTAHNAALPGDIASTVLMPGDPLRAKHIADNYLENVKQFNQVRGMLGFTGTYKGKRISIMASGMGAPSMGIYSYELFSHYGVDRIVRIGTCGGFLSEIEVGDLVIAMSASTDSAYASQYDLGGVFAPCADYGLLEAAVSNARKFAVRHWVGNIFSSDVFSLYSARGEDGWKKWARMGCAATDMECYALYCNAAYLGKKALTLLTCSDSNVTRKEMSPAERQTALTNMFKVALEFAQ